MLNHSSEILVIIGMSHSELKVPSEVANMLLHHLNGIHKSTFLLLLDCHHILSWKENISHTLTILSLPAEMMVTESSSAFSFGTTLTWETQSL